MTQPLALTAFDLLRTQLLCRHASETEAGFHRGRCGSAEPSLTARLRLACCFPARPAIDGARPATRGTSPVPARVAIGTDGSRREATFLGDREAPDAMRAARAPLLSGPRLRSDSGDPLRNTSVPHRVSSGQSVPLTLLNGRCNRSCSRVRAIWCRILTHSRCRHWHCGGSGLQAERVRTCGNAICPAQAEMSFLPLRFGNR